MTSPQSSNAAATIQLEIQGYTDSQGREEMNLALSQSRAESVLNELRARRVITGSFKAVGYGEENPVADNGTEAGREANRRIEFRLIRPDTVDTPEQTTLETTSQSVDTDASQTPRRKRYRMSRFEFVLATAIILFVAFCMGWFANWLLHRFTRVAADDVAQLDRMSQELHEAEETRDQAITYLQQREAELTNQLAQTEAELRAAMDGLRDARHEAEEMRAYIESLRAG